MLINVEKPKRYYFSTDITVLLYMQGTIEFVIYHLEIEQLKLLRYL